MHGGWLAVDAVGAVVAVVSSSRSGLPREMVMDLGPGDQ